MCHIGTCGCIEYCETLLDFGFCEKVTYEEEACEPCSEMEDTG